MLQRSFSKTLHIFARNMATSGQSALVKHDNNNKEFSIEFQDVLEKGYLTYVNIDEKTVDLQHTFVPESLRGKGIGKLLAEAAFKYVVDHDLKMKLTCWYLQKYIDENPIPEYTKRVLKQ